MAGNITSVNPQFNYVEGQLRGVHKEDIKDIVVEYEKVAAQKQAEYEKQAQERIDKGIFIDEIPAYYSKKENLIRFESSGNPTYDRNVELGLDYKSSCFDFTNINDYNELTAKEDFTGMSEEEIYKAIYEKFQHCYGENFLDAEAIDYPSTPQACDDAYIQIIRKFENEVNSHCETGSRILRREALYEGMSDSEIRDAVIKKYTFEDGTMTLAGLHKAVNELDSIFSYSSKGGLDGGMRYMMSPFWGSGTTPFQEAQGFDFYATREFQINRPVSTSYLMELSDRYNKTARFGGMGTAGADFYTVMEQIKNNI